MRENPVVHFMLVSDKDMQSIRVGKEIDHVVIDHEFWLGSVDSTRYFTSDPKALYDPSTKPWFVFKLRWTSTGYEDIDRYDKIATNGSEWTYVKQSLGGTRIPFTDSVKAKITKHIEKFWRKA